MKPLTNLRNPQPAKTPSIPMMRNTTRMKIMTLLTILVVAAADCFGESALPVDFWTVKEGSPQVSKITITRKYHKDTRDELPQYRVLSVWWAPDGACLAWASVNIHYIKQYGTGNLLEIENKTKIDTVQANYSADIITAPNFARSMTGGFKAKHFVDNDSPCDKYGNWTASSTSLYGNSDEYVERQIEYVGSESAETKAEIAYFQNIRTSGTQKATDCLTANEQKSLFEKAYPFRKDIKIIFALIFGLYPWLKYRKWKKEYYHYDYNYYGMSPYISSAVAILLTNGLYALLLPKITKMLVHDRKLGFTETTLMTLLNVIALGYVLNVWLKPHLWLFGTLLAIIGALMAYIYLDGDLVYKCPKCRSVNTKMAGITDGGVMVENSQNHHDDANMEGDVLVKTHTYSNRNTYYQRNIYNYRCRDCNATWKRTRKGRYLGYDEHTKKETERLR